MTVEPSSTSVRVLGQTENILLSMLPWMGGDLCQTNDGIELIVTVTGEVSTILHHCVTHKKKRKDNGKKKSCVFTSYSSRMSTIIEHALRGGRFPL